MKRAGAILLLVLFLLNALGYYGIFVGLQSSHARLANDLLDEEAYSGGDAVTFKIPVTLAYATDHDEYERVTGEFEHNGDVYRLVKQKLYKDTLYVVCVKDIEGKKINQAMADYVKTFTDKPSNAKQQNSKSLVPTFIKDYLSTGVSIASQSFGWTKSIEYTELPQAFRSTTSFGIEYPPRLISLI